jgi:DNA (cytosine-5)-methyltransferase 1
MNNKRKPYRQLLEEGWTRHIAPRADGAPTVISTFAGCGGSSLGYSMAGYRELLAVEWDDNAVETFRLNFPDVPVYHGDIAKLSVDRCLELAGLSGAGELDVLDGSPPCQGFSTAGRRIMEDSRNQLFQEFVRLLRGLRPKAFVMENVAGMVKGKMRLVFVEILKELKASGYAVRAKRLNAMWFNVPQSRERLIFIGVREDLGIDPGHPRPERRRPITAGKALAGLEIDEGERGILLAAGRKHPTYKYWDHIQPGKGNDSIPGVKTGFGAKKLDPARPSRTVLKTDGNIGMHGLMHWAERRRFTRREYTRLFSIPDQFEFAGGWSDAVSRMGNSVPPFMMEAIAKYVCESVFNNA